MAGRRRPGGPNAALVLLVATLLGAGCRKGERPVAEPPRGDELQTVEVEPPPDALVDPSRDVQERRRAEAFSGVLPEAFPRHLPLPAGASLVDQGPRWVELLVGRTPAVVGKEYPAQARAAGWQVEARGGGEYRLSRGTTTVAVQLAAAGPSTRLRIEY